MFKALKQVASLFKERESPKRILVITVEREDGGETRIFRISESVYPTFKLLMRDIAEMHNSELKIIEE